MHRQDRIRRLYRRMLRLYPRAFRTRYEADLLQVFDDRRRERRFRGTLGGVRLVLFLLRDFVTSMPLAADRRADDRVGTMMSDLLRDLRYAFRMLVKNALFTTAAVTTLGIGIGANTALFSVVEGVLLKPLPFRESDRLVSMWLQAPGLNFDRVGQSAATYLTFRSDTEVLEDVAIWHPGSAQVLEGDDPREVRSLMVTDGFLPLLGVDAELGRRFSASDDSPGAPQTVMLTHGYWESVFGADPEVIGKPLMVSGAPRTIIGVLPERFDFLDEDPSFLYPARFDPASVGMGQFNYQMVGRMKPGVALGQVADEVRRLLPLAADRYPGPITPSVMAQARMGPAIVPLKDDLVGTVRPVLWVFLGAVSVVFLIATANVANLFLVRAEGRATDVAVRTAMGASRTDIAGQFLAESVVLGLGGGAVGVGLAWIGLRVLVSMAPSELPRLDQIGIDPLVLGFTAMLSIGAGLLFGLFPLIRYRRPDLIGFLKEGGRGGSQGRSRHRVRNALVVGQVALALVLVIGSGLMMRSFEALRRVDPGFDTSDAFTFGMTIPSTVASGADGTAVLWEQILERLRSIPGVTSVGVASGILLGGWDDNDPLYVEGRPVAEGQIPPVRRFNNVMPGYFAAVGIPLVAGRDLDWADIHSRRRVVVISENLAAEYWNSAQEALGRRIATLNIRGGEPIWYEIIGVAGAVHDKGFDQDPTKEVYWPFVHDDLDGTGAESRRSMAFIVRGEPGVMPGLDAAVRQAVKSVTASVPVASAQTMSDLVARSMARTSFALVMLGIAGAVALMLGTVGMYAAVSYGVSQRTREIGVRVALGAGRSDVSGMIVREGMSLAGVGVCLGLAGALGFTHLMTSLLYGVDPVDLPTFGAVAVSLVVVAALASWVPAHRAAGVDPAVTLREE